MRAKSKRFYARTPRRPAPVHPATGHTFLIVVEGAATEPAYFEGVRLKLERKTAAVIVSHGKHTDPVGIVREAIKLRDAKVSQSTQSATVPYDQVWVVFDRETQNHPRHKQVPTALQLAKDSGVQVALSIPSFEFWLLLHFDYTTKAFDGCPAVKRALKRFIKDYEKSNLPLSDLLSRVATAIKHAARCHAHWETVQGDRNPSTHVDKLLRALNDSARAEVRLF
jgi:RloB-like protein